MRAICVFCGSSSGNKAVYQQAGQELGQLLAQQRIRLIYGAANCGLMVAVANAVLDHGGEVAGVIPEVIDRLDLTHTKLTHLHRVTTMHERKALMAKLSDGFIAMPGGIGTLDELCEIICWAQLGLHDKPIGILNTNGYYDGFLTFLEHTINEGFIKPADLQRVIVAQTPAGLLEQMSLDNRFG
jgi:uncharacterized protein (TIGR00730 family)